MAQRISEPASVAAIEFRLSPCVLAALLLAGTLASASRRAGGHRPRACNLRHCPHPAAGETVLLNALDAELKRAMSSLGSDGAAGAQTAPALLPQLRRIPAGCPGGSAHPPGGWGPVAQLGWRPIPAVDVDYPWLADTS